MAMYPFSTSRQGGKFDMYNLVTLVKIFMNLPSLHYDMLTGECFEVSVCRPRESIWPDAVYLMIYVVMCSEDRGLTFMCV